MDSRENNFMEKVDTFLELSKNTTDGITALRDSIDAFTNNVKDLKKLPESLNELKNLPTLNTSLSTLNENMVLLDDCNKKLEGIFTNVEKYKKMEEVVSKHYESFEIINGKLVTIGEFVNKLLDNSESLNIENITDILSNLTEKFEELNYYITEYIIRTFNEKLNNSIFLIKQELTTLQKSFNSFRSESIRITNEMRNQNDAIKDYFAEIINTNRQILEAMEKSNNNPVNNKNNHSNDHNN